MSDKTPRPRDKKRFKVPPAYAGVLFVTLALAVVGIELSRRWKAPHGAPTASPTVGDRSAIPFPRELRDAAGTTLVIPARPSRIASQTLGTDEILLAICPSERVVALSKLAED